MQTADLTPIARALHDRALNRGLGARARHLIPFFFAAYVLAWLPMAAAVLAARGAIALPIPETGLIALATLGICLAGIGTAALEADDPTLLRGVADLPVLVFADCRLVDASAAGRTAPRVVFLARGANDCTSPRGSSWPRVWSPPT